MAGKLGFGLMRLPMKEGKIDKPQLCEMVDRFLEQGFTYFDTAWMYCSFKSENAVKDVLVSRHPRDRFTLATKLHSGFLKTAEDRDRIFGEQLEKTGAGFFDYYLLHDINVQSIETYDRLDCFRWIAQKKEEGLIRHMGFSYHDGPELLDRVLTEHPEMEFVQLQINYLDWDNAGVQARRCYDVACKHRKPVIVMEPVKGGTLAQVPAKAEALLRAAHADWSVASWAMRFAASLENVMMVLSGMSNMAQIEDNTSFMKDMEPLKEEEQNVIRRVVDVLNESIVIPCTGCSYCTDGCPKKIAIPQIFSLYNGDTQESADKPWTPQGEYYENLVMTTG